MCATPAAKIPKKCSWKIATQGVMAKCDTANCALISDLPEISILMRRSCEPVVRGPEAPLALSLREQGASRNGCALIAAHASLQIP
jgi:hypothetical protein